MNPHMLRQYTQLTEFLGRVLGPDYEIAFHDLTNKERSLVAIANNSISDRDVGAPLTNVALKILADHSYQHSDYRVHYHGKTCHGKPLRSSTLFIKDEQGELVGLLCINFDDHRYTELSEKIRGLCHPDIFVETNFSYDENLLSPMDDEVETYPRTAEGTAAEAVANVLNSKGLSAQRLTLDERMDVIQQLDSKGIFLLKGAVKDVAEALSCSPASVYRYLTNLRRDD